MKQTLLFFVLLYSVVSHSQNLELVWHKGQPPVDVWYNSDDTHIKLSDHTHGLSCIHSNNGSKHSLAFRANIANTSSVTLSDVQFQVDLYNTSNQLLHTLYSNTVSAILSHDTLDYSFFTTDSIMTTDYFGPLPVFQYDQHHYVCSINHNGSNSGPLDTISFKPFETWGHNPGLSMDFGNYGNPFGTDQLGTDGGGFAVLLPYSCPTFTASFELVVSPNTVDGGDIEVVVYDSTGFSANGVFSNVLLYESFPVIRDSLNPNLIKGEFDFNAFDALDQELATNGVRYYWFAFFLFSNSGNHPIEIFNDTLVQQPSTSCMYFSGDDAQWYPAENATWFSSPALTFKLYEVHGDPSVTVEGIHKDEIKFYPNPADTHISFSLPDSGPAELMLFNMQGQIVKEVKVLSPEYRVSVEDLPAGPYLVHILQKGEIVHSEKLLLLKV